MNKKPFNLVKIKKKKPKNLLIKIFKNFKK